MSVSQGSFANQAPDSGSIRIFFQTINNKDVVKSLTISDVDKDGDDISISLTELDIINLPLSSSGVDVTLQVNSIIQKPGYHFIGVQDISVNSLSASLSAPISITPYLTETFFYNDYNATISNANSTRTSTLKYDVDRSGGQVKPTNYNAIAGIESVTVSGMETIIDDVTTPFSRHINFAVGNNLGFITSSTAAVQDDRDLDFRVGPEELNAAIGNVQNSIVSASATFFENGGILNVSSSLHLRFSNVSNFNTLAAGHVGSTLLLAGQLYDNGDYNATTFTAGSSAASLTIPSGSYGGTVYMRLEQRNIVTASSSGNHTIIISPLLLNNPESNKFLSINMLPAVSKRTPFAPFAPVQDSNYSATGIVNARYKGTKTTQQDYSGIEPAIAAKTFEAAVYTLNENDNFICSQSLADRSIQSFLFIGTEDLPGASISALGTINSNNALTIPLDGTIDTTFQLTVADLALRKQIRPGDILQLSNGSDAELVQIATAVLSAPSSNLMNISVQRDYNNTGVTLAAFPSGTNVSRFANTRIFEIKGNRLLASTEKKIWVKENRTILKTSQAGYVTELSTTCPV